MGAEEEKRSPPLQLGLVDDVLEFLPADFEAESRPREGGDTKIRDDQPKRSRFRIDT